MRSLLRSLLGPCDSAGPVAPEMVLSAERELGVSFPTSYRFFLETYGAVVCNGFEIAGLHGFTSDEDPSVSPPLWSHVVVDTKTTPWQPGHGGLEVMPLHSHIGEHVALVHWPANEKFQRHTHVGGEEIFVISGEFIDEHGRYPAGTWIRSPHMSAHNPWVEEETLIWVKTGHL